MSKEHKWLPAEWRILAKASYLKMLRAATKITGIGEKTSPRKKQKVEASSSSLVRNLSSDEDEPTPAGAEEGMLDVVTEEAENWKTLDKATIREF